jgi:hypothetical protein
VGASVAFSAQRNGRAKKRVTTVLFQTLLLRVI